MSKFTNKEHLLPQPSTFYTSLIHHWQHRCSCSIFPHMEPVTERANAAMTVSLCWLPMTFGELLRLLKPWAALFYELLLPVIWLFMPMHRTDLNQMKKNLLLTKCDQLKDKTHRCEHTTQLKPEETRAPETGYLRQGESGSSGLQIQMTSKI